MPSKIITLRQALRSAASSELEDGWVFVLNENEPAIDAPCLVVFDEFDSSPFAESAGFSLNGLESTTLEDMAIWLTQFQERPSDELLFEAFVYYLKFDAWLPSPRALGQNHSNSH
jgi:hypothetical protein